MLGSFGQLLGDCSVLSIDEGGISVFASAAILIACSLEQSSTDAFALFCPGSDVRFEAAVSPESLAGTMFASPFSEQWRLTRLCCRNPAQSAFWDDLVRLRAGIAGAQRRSSLVATIVGRFLTSFH
jgi:hypothetical protein